MPKVLILIIPVIIMSGPDQFALAWSPCQDIHPVTGLQHSNLHPPVGKAPAQGVVDTNIVRH